MSGRIVEFALNRVLPSSYFVDNIDAGLKRDIPRLFDEVSEGSLSGVAALVGGGPSLKKFIDRLRGFNGTIFGCGTVHDYLINNGVIPDYHVLMDPDVETCSFLQKPNKKVTYLVASQCHQKTFDALEGYKILLWHAFNDLDLDGTPLHHYNNEKAIRGGVSVLLRAFPLANVLGFKKFEFFGFDCSFPTESEDQHAYPYPFYKEEPVSVSVDGVKYITTPGLMIQLRTFVNYITLSPDIEEVKVHGDSLVAAVCYRDVRCQT